jgi:hypothetical protein
MKIHDEEHRWIITKGRKRERENIDRNGLWVEENRW